MNEKALVVTNLRKEYAPTWYRKYRGDKPFVAVRDISFSIDTSEILGFLGANGAGKTTTMQMLLDLLTPTAGTIEFAPNSRIAFASGYMRLPSNLSVRECLMVHGMLYGMSQKEINQKIEYISGIFRLSDLLKRNATRLSAGQTTTVILARTFLIEPDVILLDEPTAALDPENAQRIRSFILEYSHQHAVSMLFTSHNMAEVTELCDRIIVLRNGEIVANNTPELLAATISHVKVQLLVTANIDRLTEHLTKNSFEYTQEEHNFIEIKVEEHCVAQLLCACSRAGIEYSQISIDKPTLEDYFVALTR